jgi:hypothetical protein
MPSRLARSFVLPLLVAMTACGTVELPPPEDSSPSLATEGQGMCCPIPLQGEAEPYCMICGCGDGICGAGENGTSCPEDCWCGDGICRSDENESSCPWDCWCGDGVCRGETIYTCPHDCGCP